MKVCPTSTANLNGSCSPLELWKVYLPAIDGIVPRDMVKTIRAFLEFCYLAHQDVHNHSSISQIESTLQEFRAAREIFWKTGI